MKYEIDLPELPDTHELVGHVVPQVGDLYLTDTNNVAEWVLCERGFSHQLYITARKKRTLADWANEQESFKALVSIHRDRLEIRLVYNTDGYWIFDAAFMQRQRVYLGVPPGFAELQLVNGKWELA